ncbi:unnamed protein product [Sphenostylis stenocarpa]|uniref:Uncharacterized protein n=1 Tax=Sphenostylis stenocarpa TaxID=92480 RepID=A0AA86T8D5_9FABA|nr:unnamed protein product [Sphenostylis stenocarpa]
MHLHGDVEEKGKVRITDQWPYEEVFVTRHKVVKVDIKYPLIAKVCSPPTSLALCHPIRYGMEWKKCYLDVILVPLGFLMSFGYHFWLWHTVRTHPHTTIIGINASGRRNWVASMMKDNDKKNILAVQSLRNTIMGATLMATTSILLCSGLAAIISSTYSVKKPLEDTVYGGHGEFMISLKYVTSLSIFLFSFFCHSLSIRFINQVNILINTPQDPMSLVTPEYVNEILEKGFLLNTVGNRLFYAALPLLLWIFGPVLVFLCSLTMVPVLYNLDFVVSAKEKMDENENRDFGLHASIFPKPNRATSKFFHNSLLQRNPTVLPDKAHQERDGRKNLCRVNFARHAMNSFASFIARKLLRPPFDNQCLHSIFRGMSRVGRRLGWDMRINLGSVKYTPLTADRNLDPRPRVDQDSLTQWLLRLG